MLRITRFKYFMLLALATALGSLLLLALLLQSSTAQDSPATSNTDNSAPSPTPQSGCCGESTPEDDKPHLLAASYYSIRDNLTAVLMLNNKGPRPLEVRPTLFSMSGERLDLAPLMVDATSFREIDLREFGIAGTAFEEGSLQLFHRGRDLVLGAQIYLVDAEHSFSFEEKLTELTPLGATRLEAVWWMPSPRARVQLVVSNTKDESLTVTAQLAGNDNRPHDTATTVTVELAPHETRVFDAQRDFPGREDGRSARIEAVSLEHAGANGALLARAMVQDEQTGYSSTVQFSNPRNGNQLSITAQVCA